MNLLAKFGWHFEINVNHTQMDIVREFVLRVPEVPLILDHCGKPGIKEGAIDQFRDDVAFLSKRPNMWIKLSDLPVEADLDNWTEDDLRPYIAATLDAFGTERTIFAADYPILPSGDDDPAMGRRARPGLRRPRPVRGRDPRDLPRQRHPLLPAGLEPGMTNPLALRQRSSAIGPRTPARFGGPKLARGSRSRSRWRAASSAW